jgi:regulatory protein
VDAYTTALTLLSRRELSTRQLRDRLTRREFEPQDIDRVIERLTADGTLDDHRVAVASARTEAVIRRRGRRRVLQHVQQLGISPGIARSAVDEVFGELDEGKLLDEAIRRRLKGADATSLDGKAVARLVRALVAQGFDAGQVYARLRRRAAQGDE